MKSNYSLFHIQDLTCNSLFSEIGEKIANCHLDRAHVWQIDLKLGEEKIEEYLHYLSQIERESANGFYDTSDKYRYITSHGIMKIILSKYLACYPAAVEYSITELGKPFLSKQHKSDDIHFNLSHSTDKALVGISKSYKIGVDIECFNEKINLECIADLILNEEEKDLLQDLNSHKEIEQYLYQIWTCKEAILKAFGTGLNTDPRCVVIKNIDWKKNKIDFNLYELEYDEIQLNILNIDSNYFGALCLLRQSSILM